MSELSKSAVLARRARFRSHRLATDWLALERAYRRARWKLASKTLKGVLEYPTAAQLEAIAVFLMAHVERARGPFVSTGTGGLSVTRLGRLLLHPTLQRAYLRCKKERRAR